MNYSAQEVQIAVGGKILVEALCASAQLEDCIIRLESESLSLLYHQMGKQPQPQPIHMRPIKFVTMIRISYI